MDQVGMVSLMKHILVGMVVGTGAQALPLAMWLLKSTPNPAKRLPRLLRRIQP